MDTVQLNEIKNIVIAQISELEQQLSLTQASSQTVELDQTLAGRVSRIDAIQQQKMAQSSFARDNKRLAELNNTLRQLLTAEKKELEYYGLCEECDEAIAIARLRIKPESKFCITCQQRLES